MPQTGAAARVLGPSTRIAGKYVLAKRLAHGGMGDVWLAKNETTNAQVALKILRPAKDEKTQAEDRFRREARLGGLLAHRSIVRIFDFLDEDGALVLVMELLRGETLEQFIERRGPLSTREALAVAVAILSALQHGHEQGVVHRDVKPANIFLAVEPDGHVLPKLLDYGIAKMPKSDSKTIDGLVLGTPSYMSPEQIRSEDAIDGRSDLFSAAACFYEMLTGTCPFQAPTPSAAIAAVLQNAVDPDPRIEPKLWIEIQRALSKRPMQRHASASELATALCAAAGETMETLATALVGTAPRDAPPVSGPVTAPARETQSVGGQSVASRPMRRSGNAWWPWAVVGTVVGIVAVIAATRMNVHSSAPSDAASGMNVHSTPSAAAAPDPATASPPPPASTSAAPTPPSTAAPSSPATSPRHRPRPKPHAPRPVATSPGF